MLDQIILEKQTRDLASEQIQRQLMQIQMMNYPFMLYSNYNSTTSTNHQPNFYNCPLNSGQQENSPGNT
jgi:hypothetical protein